MSARHYKSSSKRKLRDSPRLPVAEAEHNSSDLGGRCDAPASSAGHVHSERPIAQEDATRDQCMLLERPVYFKGTHMPVDGWILPCK